MEARDRLKAYAEKHGITWTGSVKRDGEFWRAKLEFSDGNVIYHGTGRTQDEAVERAISFAIGERERVAGGDKRPINLRGAC